jgi:2-polyprenyl-6-methoxyphenol hydroxylase-like FAD-dependent oxidoreductase
VTVLIAGGGPVGLSTGIALRRWGVECTLVERHPSTLEYPKGRGVSARTMEIFRQWGIEDDITAAGLPRTDTEHFFVGDTLLADEFQRFDRAELGREPTPSPTERLICPQDLVEAILLQRALASGVDIQFSTELVALRNADDRVIATVRDVGSDVETRLETEFVVAADGGRSTARSLLGIGTPGPGPIGNSVSILVHADLAERVKDRLATIYKVAHPHESAFFAVVDNDHRWLLMMARDPDNQREEMFTEQHCVELVRAALGDDSVPLEFKHRWFFQPTALVADSFRAGRIFLAGDAAHLTTPFGALGMNCGIADAHNLAWKLAGVIQGWAGLGLLDTYEEERRPVALATTDASILREDISSGPPRAAFAGVTMGFGYESAAVVPDGTNAPKVPDAVHDYVPTGRPGHRAPHIWIDHARRTSTLDLFGEHFALLVDRDDIGNIEADVPLQTHAIPGPEWRSLYGIEPGGAVLVRPDGHVAWRAVRPVDDLADAVRSALRVCTRGEDAPASEDRTPD